MTELVQETIAAFERELDAIWLERPAELDAMRDRNAATAREFGCWCYAWSQLVNLGDFLCVGLGMAREGVGDAATIAAYAGRQCALFGSMLESSAHMPHAAQLLARAAAAYEQVDTHADLYALTLAVQRWVCHMSFWTDMELPWDAVSHLVHEAWHPGMPDPNEA